MGENPPPPCSLHTVITQPSISFFISSTPLPYNSASVNRAPSFSPSTQYFAGAVKCSPHLHFILLCATPAPPPSDQVNSLLQVSSFPCPHPPHLPLKGLYLSPFLPHPGLSRLFLNILYFCTLARAFFASVSLSFPLDCFLFFTYPSKPPIETLCLFRPREDE